MAARGGHPLQRDDAPHLRAGRGGRAPLHRTV